MWWDAYDDATCSDADAVINQNTDGYLADFPHKHSLRGCAISIQPGIHLVTLL